MSLMSNMHIGLPMARYIHGKKRRKLNKTSKLSLDTFLRGIQTRYTLQREERKMRQDTHRMNPGRYFDQNCIIHN